MPRLHSSGSGEDDTRSDASGSLERIPPLPQHLLPEFYTQEATQRRGGVPAEPPPLRRAAPGGDGDDGAPHEPKRRRIVPSGEAVSAPLTADELAGRGDRPVCVTCGLRFTSAAQLVEHKQGKKHRLQERKLRLGPQAAAAVPHRPASRGPPPVELQVSRIRSLMWRICRSCFHIRIHANATPHARAGPRMRAVSQKLHQRGAAAGAYWWQMAPNAAERGAASLAEGPTTSESCSSRAPCSKTTLSHPHAFIPFPRFEKHIATIARATLSCGIVVGALLAQC